MSYTAPCWAKVQPAVLTSLSPYWAMLYPSELAAPSKQCCTILSHGALYWATLHLTELRSNHQAALRPIELRWTLLSYTAPTCELAHPKWATLRPTELHWTLLSYAEPYWATLNPTELRWTLLSYAVPYWATLFSTQTLWATLQPNGATFCTRTFVKFYQMPECRTIRYRNKCTPVRYRKATVPDWNAGCRNTDTGGIGFDTDAQLCLFATSRDRTTGSIICLFSSFALLQGRGERSAWFALWWKLQRACRTGRCGTKIASEYAESI